MPSYTPHELAPVRQTGLTCVQHQRLAGVRPSPSPPLTPNHPSQFAGLLSILKLLSNQERHWIE